MRSVRDRCRSPRTRCAVSAASAAAVRARRRESGRARRTRWLRRCSARRSRRSRRPGRSRRPAGRAGTPSGSSRTVTATSVPCDERLDQRGVAVGKAATMAAGRSSAESDDARPRADPPRDGLTTSGQPERVHDRASRTAAAPSSRNVACGQRHAGRCRHARGRDEGLGDRLVAGRGGRPRDGRRHRRCRAVCSTSRTAPSSPVAPCSSGQTTSGGWCERRRAGWRRHRARASRSPAPRSASATRRPERSETSRSWRQPAGEDHDVLMRISLAVGTHGRRRAGPARRRRCVTMHRESGRHLDGG